jgi:hypothetical protein
VHQQLRYNIPRIPRPAGATPDSAPRIAGPGGGHGADTETAARRGGRWPLPGGASAVLGFTTLSHVLFGLGATSFVLLGSIISQRLYVVPSLPPPLLPTVAIELAPPMVAGNAWFAINGGRVDTPAAILGGPALLMLLVQVRLIPMYRRATFGPGFWAFSFPFAAAVTYGVDWLAAEHVRGGGPRLRPRRPPHRRVRPARRAHHLRPGPGHVPAPPPAARSGPGLADVTARGRRSPWAGPGRAPGPCPGT